MMYAVLVTNKRQTESIKCIPKKQGYYFYMYRINLSLNLSPINPTKSQATNIHVQNDDLGD